ncbi:hypothetical protein B0H12DRAFT_1225890 [Mycena haematopus]|nr:hypothetical protein B0H12DRAFT_1225890 [Mycena haematopus]
MMTWLFKQAHESTRWRSQGKKRSARILYESRKPTLSATAPAPAFTGRKICRRGTDICVKPNLFRGFQIRSLLAITRTTSLPRSAPQQDPHGAKVPVSKKNIIPHFEAFVDELEQGLHLDLFPPKQSAGSSNRSTRAAALTGFDNLASQVWRSTTPSTPPATIELAPHTPPHIAWSLPACEDTCSPVADTSLAVVKAGYPATANYPSRGEDDARMCAGTWRTGAGWTEDRVSEGIEMAQLEDGSSVLASQGLHILSSAIRNIPPLLGLLAARGSFHCPTGKHRSQPLRTFRLQSPTLTRGLLPP